MNARSDPLPYPTCHCPACDPTNGRQDPRPIETVTVKGDIL